MFSKIVYFFRMKAKVGWRRKQKQRCDETVAPRGRSHKTLTQERQLGSIFLSVQAGLASYSQSGRGWP